MFYTEFLGLCMICLLTKCHTPSYSGSHVIAFKPRGKYIFQTPVILFYILKNSLT